MPETLQKQAGLILARRRVELGCTLQQIADVAGMSPPSLAQLESGHKNATLERLQRVAEAYQLEFVLVGNDLEGRALPDSPRISAVEEA